LDASIPSRKHGRRLPRLKSTTEPLSAASAVGADDRTRSGAEQRARTTVVAFVAAAQNGTSGVLNKTSHRSRRIWFPVHVPVRESPTGGAYGAPPAATFGDLGHRHTRLL